MKFCLTCVVTIVMLVGLTLAAKAPSVQVVDSGSFGVYLNGKRVATESFKIEQRTEGSVAKSELKAQDGATQRSEMQLTEKGEIVHYSWQELQPKKATVSVDPKDEFLSETVSAGPNEKTFSVPHMMPHTTPILDDNFFLHREILLWRYLASGCTTNTEGLKCAGAPQQFGVLVPAQHSSETVTVDFKAREKITLHGNELDCNAFRLSTDNSQWVVYLDYQQKLVRIVAPAAGVEVTRD
jgi:hypothetical protein